MIRLLNTSIAFVYGSLGEQPQRVNEKAKDLAEVGRIWRTAKTGEEQERAVEAFEAKYGVTLEECGDCGGTGKDEEEDESGEGYYTIDCPACDGNSLYEK